jgi:single-stranded DNA-binding protein
VAWNRLGELATAKLRSGDHVHIQGRLVSNTYDKQYDNGKQPTIVKQTFWHVRANTIRKLNRTESQSGSAPSDDAPASLPDDTAVAF